MIVELFGLPGSGKTTAARSFAGEGAVVIAAPPRLGIIGENVIFALCHPVRALRLYFFISSHAPKEYRRLLLENLFFAANAKYIRAKRVSRKGRVAIIDQGHFQTFLSLFDSVRTEQVLRRLIRILPRPDLLLVLEASKEERDRRVAERGRAIRASAAEDAYPRALALFDAEHVSYNIVLGAESTKLLPILTKHISYVTSARMPTEKAHGVSIAHMCTAFAAAGHSVSLIVPKRKNPITKDLFDYYGVPQGFSFREIISADLLGSGLTSPPFFFLQRIFFLRTLRGVPVPSGIVYTREPEIAWKFSETHLTIFEAHRWPRGFVGWLQARLVRNATLVVCNSHGTEAAARSFGITRTLVAPNGYDPELFKNVSKTRTELGLPEGVLALYAGSEREGKGADIAHKAGVAVITGKAPTEVPAYLMSADILVLPNTREGESERFTSPIKLFEYLAAGKAIIASDLPSVREILGKDDALFVPPGDAPALAGAIALLVKDTARREQLAARAKELSVSYTWDVRAGRILEAIGGTGA